MNDICNSLEDITSSMTIDYNKGIEYRSEVYTMNLPQKNVHKCNLELQHKSCNQCEEIVNIVKCNACFDPDSSDEECLFRDFRAFCADKKGLKFGSLALTKIKNSNEPYFNLFNYCSDFIDYYKKMTKSSNFTKRSSKN
ncbi:hypothetical protein K501DRAFT_268427 [Backusella circina FSU 941]|nr:hypothetical protein K501DRAFT_268427 [Backusella circina FSU 941]